MRTPTCILAISLIFLASCSQNRAETKMESTGSDRQKDSLEAISSVKNVYKWHDSVKSELTDFNVLIVDSFQTGLDSSSFEKTFKAIKESHLFSTSFVASYKELGEIINKKLKSANPKYLNEINFPFQDADPWTYFQDDAGQFWNKLIISDFNLSSDSASLNWYIQDKDSKTDKYLVKLVKENKKWLVSYLEGFNKKMYLQ